MSEQAALAGFDQEPAREKTTCRSCGAPVFWAKTQNGKNGIFDWEPVENGNVTLSADGGAVVYGARETNLGRPRYVSHFSTCPDSKGWRRRA